MRIASLAIGLFLAAFLIHWIVWRVRIPRRQTRALLLILLGMLPVGFAAALLVPALQGVAALGLWGWLQIAVFHVAMSLAYIVAYSSLEEPSPSMTLLLRVADAGKKGCAREDLVALLQGVSPVEVRLAAMVRDTMVADLGGIYRLTPKGRIWAEVFSWWLRFLKMDKGG